MSSREEVEAPDNGEPTTAATVMYCASLMGVNASDLLGWVVKNS